MNFSQLVKKATFRNIIIFHVVLSIIIMVWIWRGNISNYVPPETISMNFITAVFTGDTTSIKPLISQESIQMAEEKQFFKHLVEMLEESDEELIEEDLKAFQKVTCNKRYEVSDSLCSCTLCCDVGEQSLALELIQEEEDGELLWKVDAMQALSKETTNQNDKLR